MKKMFKSMIAATVSASVLFTSLAPYAMAENKVISQEDLEELKKQLEEEIRRYDLRFEYDEDDSFFGSIFSAAEDLFLYGNTPKAATGAQSKSDGFVEYEMLEEVCSVADSYAMTDSAIDYLYDPGYGFNTEEYGVVKERGFVKVSTDPLSTFAADVDTGSYCNLRRMLKDGYQFSEIPSGSVRTEELLNYFDYTVEKENISDGKFSLQYELSPCPWNDNSELLLMTVQANTVEVEHKGNNFVFLLDTSGSMDYSEKIALAKCSIKLLSYTLSEEDRVSIVTYSGDSYTALDSCPGNDYEAICEALDSIYPYGGTNGSGGISAAYALAEKNFIEDGNNRVFILSDGDMNLGITSTSGLVDLITEKKETGIFLTVLGFGSGNYSDLNMESIADAGNGNYFYIDCLDESQHVLIEKQKETTLTVAKDVKFQAEFNPATVSEYRLIGYENRDVADDDFTNDAVDGGEVGAGQQVTLLYEIVRTEASNDAADSTGSLKYQGNRTLTDAALSDELLTVSINYKEPSSDVSQTESYPVLADADSKSVIAGKTTSADMNLAISIAEYSMLLHDSAFKGTASLEEATYFAQKALIDNNIYRLGYLGTFLS